VDDAQSLVELRFVEAAAAKCYFESLATPLSWSGKGVPDEWRRWNGARISGATTTNKAATHPFNALLNYGYVLTAARLEREATLFGFDAAFGFLHVPDDYRASLAWDLLELVRADVDEAVWRFARERRWRRGDFDTDRRGRVWLGEPLARVAAQRLWVRAEVVEAAVEWLARRL
jgi:CRISPR-associated protein Cas1